MDFEQEVFTVANLNYSKLKTILKIKQIGFSFIYYQNASDKES